MDYFRIADNTPKKYLESAVVSVMAIYGQSDGTIFSMKRIIAVTLTVLAVLGLSGSSAQKQSLDGAWKSEGYGMVLDIQGATLKSFEVTATTCVPGDAAQSEDTSIDGREATFKTTDGDVFFIRSGGTADHRLLHNVSSVSGQMSRSGKCEIRLPALPRVLDPSRLPGVQKTVNPSSLEVIDIST